MKKYLVFITSVFCAIGVLSCKKETISQNSQKKIILDDSKHIWYYFQNGKLNKTSKISEVPVYPKKLGQNQFGFHHLDAYQKKIQQTQKKLMLW